MMVRKAMLAGILIAGLIAPASAAWADAPDPAGQRGTEPPALQVDPLDYVDHLPSGDSIIMFCMFGWDVTITSNENGVVQWTSVPGNCPIFSNFTHIE